MGPLLIVKAGCTFASLRARRGDYEDWIQEGVGLAGGRVEIARVHEGDALPPPDALAGVVVTGSPAMVSDREPWSERTAQWLARAVEAEVPLLGICYGHQLLAHGLGGRVGVNPLGREIGTVVVQLRDSARDDPLLGGFGESLRVQATHVESALELPPGARPLAASSGDPHHAFAVGRFAWGVQFHPEFDADITRAYIEERRETLRAEGLDPERLHREARDSEHGRLLLRRFAELLRA